MTQPKEAISLKTSKAKEHTKPKNLLWNTHGLGFITEFSGSLPLLATQNISYMTTLEQFCWAQITLCVALFRDMQCSRSLISKISH